MLAKRRSVFTKNKNNNFHFQNTLEISTPAVKLVKKSNEDVFTPNLKAVRHPKSKGSSLVLGNDQSPMLTSNI